MGVNIENNANNEQEVGEKEGMEIMHEIEGDANDISDSKESKLSMYDVFDQINTAGNDYNKSDDESLYKFKNQDQDIFNVINTKMSEDGIDVGFDELNNPFADAEESENNEFVIDTNNPFETEMSSKNDDDSDFGSLGNPFTTKQQTKESGFDTFGYLFGETQ